MDDTCKCNRCPCCGGRIVAVPYVPSRWTNPYRVWDPYMGPYPWWGVVPPEPTYVPSFTTDDTNLPVSTVTFTAVKS